MAWSGLNRGNQRKDFLAEELRVREDRSRQCRRKEKRRWKEPAGEAEISKRQKKMCARRAAGDGGIFGTKTARRATGKEYSAFERISQGDVQNDCYTKMNQRKTRRAKTAHTREEERA